LRPVFGAQRGKRDEEDDGGEERFHDWMVISGAWMAVIWSAVTCHRFGCLVDLSTRQSRVERLGDTSCAVPLDGDKSPA
jgi:hypothetical protein